MSATDTLNLKINVSHKNKFPPYDNKNAFMNILSLNIQSLRNKLSDPYVTNSIVNFHMIVLTETHIRQSETKLFNLPEYEVEHCVRKSGRFGGVSIFVRKDICIVVEILIATTFSIVLIMS